MEQKKDQLNPVNLVGSVFKFSIATWVNAVMYLATLILVSYVFADNSSVFGLYDLFYTASLTIVNVAMLGLDHSYIRFYNEPPKGTKDSRQLAAACMLFSIGSLFVLSAVMCVALPGQISALFFKGDATLTRFVFMMCINAFFLLVTRYFNITYRMQMKTKMFAVQSILLNFFSRMFFIVGGLFNPTLDSVIWFSLVGLGVFAAVFFIMQRKTMLPRRIEIEKQAYSPLLRYGVALMPTNIMVWLNTLFSRVYVDVVMGSDQLGIFSFMSYISMALGVLQAGFSTFWSAFIFGSYKTEQRRIRRVHDYLTFIMLSLMAAMIALQPVIFMIFGETYRAGMRIFGLMTFAPMLLIISETTVYGILIAKKTIYDSIGNAISVLGNVGLCVWLVPQYGMVGAAVALAVSGLAMFIFRTVVAQRLYKSMDRPLKTAVSIALMAALCVVGYLFADNALTVALSALGVLVYYMIVYRAELKRCFAIAREVLSSKKGKGKTA